MSKIIAERSFELKVHPCYFKTIKKRTLYEERLDYLLFKDNEDEREAILSVVNMEEYEYMVRGCKWQIHFCNETLLTYESEMPDNFVKIVEKFPKTERTVLVSFIKEGTIKKNLIFKLENPKNQFRKQKIGNEKIFDYLKNGLITAEYDSIKFEICKTIDT